MHTDTAQDALGWLREASYARSEAGVERSLVARPPGVEPVLDLASNDYLGLARHPAVVAACGRAAQEYGAGATGSRLVTGTTALHEALERRPGRPRGSGDGAGLLLRVTWRTWVR